MWSGWRSSHQIPSGPTSRRPNPALDFVRPVLGNEERWRIKVGRIEEARGIGVYPFAINLEPVRPKFDVPLAFAHDLHVGPPRPDRCAESPADGRDHRRLRLLVAGTLIGSEENEYLGHRL